MALNKPKLLLTGSSGFLGKNLCDNLNSSFEIITVGRKNSVINCDLIKSVPKLPGADIVIHAAGKAHTVPKTEAEKQEFYLVNVVGTLNLLSGIDNKALPKYFVFISSVSVYGLDFGYEIDENVTLSAFDPYGVSKIEAEQIVLDWCKKNNVICTVLRLPLLVGINPPGNLKSMLNAIRKGFYFNIAGGNAKKSMVLVSDVSKYIIRAAEVGGIYNLTDGCHPNFNELSHCIAVQLGKKNVPNMSKLFAKIIAFMGDIIGPKFPVNSDKLKKITSTLTFNDSKARKAFNWAPTPVLIGFKINE